MVDREGVPAAGALVAIAESSVPMPEIALLTDDEGRFRLAVPPGRFLLRAHVEGGSGEAAIEDAAGDEEITIVLGEGM